MSSELSSPNYFLLPDTLRDWPWLRSINPHYEICKAESDAWCESFHPFSIKGQQAFNSCDFSLLASLSYPHLDKDVCRVGCDMMMLFFVFDEHSDIVDASVAKGQADIIAHALHNPTLARPDNEWIGGEMARQFCENAMRIATKTAQRRFIHTFCLYTEAVAEQALDRDSGKLRTIDNYFKIRRHTIGARPSFVILELRMDIPDEVMTHPNIVTLVDTSVDMIAIGNDIYSYNVEQARGEDTHNIVTIVMHEHKCDLADAMQWISDLHDALAAKFLSTLKELPSFGDSALDKDVARYVSGLANWVRANEAWSFESGRYFGEDGRDVQLTRIVKILPKNAENKYMTHLAPRQRSPLA